MWENWWECIYTKQLLWYTSMWYILAQVSTSLWMNPHEIKRKTARDVWRRWTFGEDSSHRLSSKCCQLKWHCLAVLLFLGQNCTCWNPYLSPLLIQKNAQAKLRKIYQMNLNCSWETINNTFLAILSKHSWFRTWKISPFFQVPCHPEQQTTVNSWFATTWQGGHVGG